jgi:hypothetical protein
MTFKQACQRMNIVPSFQGKLNSYNSFQHSKFVPKQTTSVNSKWRKAAKNFIEISHKELMCNPEALNHLTKRDLSLDSIRKFCLGWNSENLFEDREAWGMPQIIKENGYTKKQWLPKGIVIPTFKDEKLIKVKIRRSEWHLEDHFPKYVEVSGSQQSPSIYGDISKPLIIVESELDAMLIQQYASYLVCCIALGGVSKKPDLNLHKLITESSLALLSLDHDDSGKKKYAFWIKNYPNLKPWPAPLAKSIGDGVQYYQIDIVQWIKLAFLNN